jgi:hypothetical protein
MAKRKRRKPPKTGVQAVAQARTLVWRAIKIQADLYEQQHEFNDLLDDFEDEFPSHRRFVTNLRNAVNACFLRLHQEVWVKHQLKRRHKSDLT